MDTRLEEIRKKEEEAQRQIEWMKRNRYKKMEKLDTPQRRLRKNKIDPNSVKFNVTEMIKNRNDCSPSIVKSTSKKNRQAKTHANHGHNFSLASNYMSNMRNGVGYLSSLGASNTVDNKIDISSDKLPTIDSSHKLPSLKRRLQDRLPKPVNREEVRLNLSRRKDIEKKLKDKHTNSVEIEQMISKPKKMLISRLQMLENINIGHSSPSRYHKISEVIMKNHTDLKLYQNRDLHDNQIMLS